MLRNTRAILPLALLAVLRGGANAAAQSPGTLSLADRAAMAWGIYHIISSFLPGLSQEKFDAAYADYLRSVLQTQPLSI